MIDLLIIQPTPFCNINCSYCYLKDRSNTSRISVQTIEQICDSAINDNLVGDSITVVWHAGEPLVVPPPYFRELVEAVNRKFHQKIKVDHSIQTNGTLITQEWCDLIKEFDIKIGVSIDGPAFIHDKNRRTRSNKGTFDKVLEGISLLKENDIKYHGIAVVSEYSLDYADELFSFFHDNGFYHLGLNIEEMEGVNLTSSVFGNDLYEKAQLFYKRLFQLYIESDSRMLIREFDSALNSMLRFPEILDITKIQTKSHQNTPFAIITVDYLGNFSTFSPELIGQDAPQHDDFIFGNVYKDSFKKALAGKTLKKISKEIKLGIDKCRKECEFFNVCGGGAPANKFYENKSFNSAETNYCKYNLKIPSSIVLEYLEEKFPVTA